MSGVSQLTSTRDKDSLHSILTSIDASSLSRRSRRSRS
jgi:hypothetical protein